MASTTLNFGTAVDQWVKKSKSRIQFVCQEVPFQMGTRIIMRSPVDTGYFRGNWRSSIRSRPTGVVNVYDRTGGRVIANLRRSTQAMKEGDTFYFVNNVVYGPRLEYGWSNQAPQGMVRITVAEFQSITRTAVGESKRRHA